jgi:hypothetical protein
VDCHQGAKAERGVQLDKYHSSAEFSKDIATWRKVSSMLRARKMPPDDSPRPSEDEYRAVNASLEAMLAQADRAGPVDPGRVTIRRLNRAEYTNTIRDLLGIEFNAAADFPSDDVGYGFDNIGDVLTLPPLLMEKYLDAADQIARKAIPTGKDSVDRGSEHLPESQRRILFVMPGAKVSVSSAAEQILRRLATRAYRRPVRSDELARLMKLAQKSRFQGDSFESSIQLALEAILVSPHFLFRVELDPEANGKQVRALNEYELASRLSYFLWSSMPDQELFDLAGRGELRKNLDRQVRRMVGDAKSRSLIENFAGQWLQLRNLDQVSPDKSQFPSFDQDLRRAMRTESERFFAAILHEDRSILEMIDANYTFVNARLAKFYGIQGVKGDEFRRVSLPSSGAADASVRGGVITQAAVLTVTSNPSRTSPVKRGKWILENILGTPPPDPPADVPKLQEDAKAVASGTLRQRMERHRADPNCAVCHKEMDSLGFALENFDAVGGWRTKEGNFPIDSAGILPDGRSFHGPRELKALLRGSKDQFVRCLAEKMLTYAIGRGVEAYDSPALDGIVSSAKAGDYKILTLILGVVHSDPFQKRHGMQKE